MEVKEAVAVAKAYVIDLFSEEGIGDVGLEEVEHDDETWAITLGFTRAWDRDKPGRLIPTRREYKTVRIADDGAVLSVKHRLTAGA